MNEGQFQTEATDLERWAASIQTLTDEEYLIAADFLKRIAVMRKEWEAVQRPVIKSAHETHRLALAAFRRIDDRLSEVAAKLNRLVTHYRQGFAPRHQVAPSGTLMEIDGRLMPLPAAPPPPPPPPVTGLASRETWRFEIIDEGALPEAYWMPNLKAIAETVRQQKGLTHIPGVRVFREVTTSVRV